MNEMDLSKNTMEEIPEGNIEKVEEQPKNKKALRDLLVIVLILAAFPIVLRFSVLYSRSWLQLQQLLCCRFA